MGTRNVTALTGISGSNNNAYNWSFQAAYTAFNDTQNPQFVRTVTLTSTGILLTVGGNSAGIPLASFTQALAAVCPAITWPPKITAQPPATNVIGFGNTTHIAMAATDELTGITPDISYQWKVSINSGNSYSNVANGATYANATTNTLNVINSAGLAGNLYLCVATNPSGGNNSNSCQLITDPWITKQPSNTSVAHPNAVTFPMVATGNSALSYQWQFGNGVNVSGGVYANATTNTLAISNSNGLTGTTFKVVVSDTGGSATSNTVTLTVT